MGKWPSLDKIEMDDDPIDKDDYEDRLEKLQHRLLDLQVHNLRTGGRVLIGLDGWDAAGKGGLIERIVGTLEPKSVHVWRIGAPTPEEQGRHYLWRFWNRLPAPGSWAIFDRTWYGRVLVERVRGFAAPADWQRAYAEVCEFERQLTEHGLVVAKFWLQVSKAEQLRRFKARDDDPLKRFKVDPEDWTNRTFYDAYQAAAAEMVLRTNAPAARWTVVPADDKKSARLHVLQVVCETIEAALGA